MAYEKRVCVLKQVKKGFSADGGSLSGAVYCERLGDTLTVTPRILGVAPVKEGRYALALCVEGRVLVVELRGTEAMQVPSAPSLKGGFSVLLAYLRGDAEPVAFGSCGSASRDYAPLLAALRGEGEEKKRKKIPNPMPAFEPHAPVAPNDPVAPGVSIPNLPEREEDARDAAPFRERATAYDDEAIAAGDYFAAHENEDPAPHGGEQAKAAAGDCDPPENATAPLFPRGSLTYYREVREKLDVAFERFPRDERLKAVFPQSEWVKSESALLGIVYENGTPRYLCVAVEKTGDPPAEMGEFASFVPRDAFTETEGFWVVFQDADTGEYVTVHDA